MNFSPTYFAVTVDIKSTKNTSCKSRSISLIEHFLVHFNKLLLGEISAWAVFEETLVPSFQLFLVELRVF